jgi:hypothetical protein
MRSRRRAEIENIAAALAKLTPAAAEKAREMHALLRRGAGEEAVVDRLRAILEAPKAELVDTARDLLRIGVRPTGGFRKRKTGPDRCTICEREVPFCWSCLCGFKICQACLEENRWGMTCNNITWECPDCGGMRSF